MKYFEFAAFLVRLFGDTLPQKADAAYLFGETESNESASFSRGIELVNRGVTRILAIPAHGNVCGFPGFEPWMKKLQSRGARNVSVVGIGNAGEKKANALTESLALIAHCNHETFLRARDDFSVIIVAPHFHLPRCFITLVSQALKQKSALKVYACAASTLPWNEEVVHSQGTTIGKRSELLYGELERIERYTEKGDLLSISNILQYMDKRDAT